MPVKAMALVALALVQGASQSPRELVSAAQPLAPSDIAIVLAASRDAIAGNTLRLPSLFNGHGPELRMGSTGLPRVFKNVSTIHAGIITGSVPGDRTRSTSREWIEEVTTFIDYTGGAVRRCGGSIEPGEVVIEYVRHGTESWTATARRQEADDVGGLGYAATFAMLRGTGSIESAERQQIGGREARAFTATWVPPASRNVQPPVLRGDPTPNAIGEPAAEESIQTLWIDAASLLPLRWEVNKRGNRSDGFDFVYKVIDLQPPTGMQAPDCIR